MTFDHFILDARSIYTLLSFLTFIGIVLWAYSGRRKGEFAEAANLPFADEALAAETGTTAGESQHG